MKRKEYKRPDRTKDLLHHINAHNGITTKKLFEQVNFLTKIDRLCCALWLSAGRCWWGNKAAARFIFR